jgi:hypothetical protein
MKNITLRICLLWIALIFLPHSFTKAHSGIGVSLFQDARKDAGIISTGQGTCKGRLLQMAIKNNSSSKKINVLIIRKESSAGLTTTSSVKYSGLPPGYKQPLGCGGVAGNADSLVIVYTVGAAVYAQ